MRCTNPECKRCATGPADREGRAFCSEWCAHDYFKRLQKAIDAPEPSKRKEVNEYQEQKSLGGFA